MLEPTLNRKNNRWQTYIKVPVQNNRHLPVGRKYPSNLPIGDDIKLGIVQNMS